MFRERAASGDANWPAEATRLVKSDRHIAAAINQASGLDCNRPIATACLNFG